MGGQSLLIPIAEISAKGVHQFFENLILRNETERDPIGQLHRRTVWRFAAQGISSLDNVLSAIDVEILPNRPNPTGDAVS